MPDPIILGRACAEHTGVHIAVFASKSYFCKSIIFLINRNSPHSAAESPVATCLWPGRPGTLAAVPSLCKQIKEMQVFVEHGFLSNERA